MKNLNLKNMKETIVNYAANQKEFDKIWDTFYNMACMGFILPGTWKKFFEQTSSWYVDEKNACIRDETDNIIWEYTPDEEYKA